MKLFETMREKVYFGTSVLLMLLILTLSSISIHGFNQFTTLAVASNAIGSNDEEETSSSSALSSSLAVTTDQMMEPLQSNNNFAITMAIFSTVGLVAAGGLVVRTALVKQ